MNNIPEGVRYVLKCYEKWIFGMQFQLEFSDEKRSRYVKYIRNKLKYFESFTPV